MTDNIIETIVDRIDWGVLKGNVQSRFDEAEFTSVDLQTTRAYIVSIIESSLSIYVDPPYTSRFKVSISPPKFGDRLTVTLLFGERELISWELTLEPYLF